MKTLFTLLIFCVVLFIYIHINFHLKVSDDLEVYEIDQPSKDKLEEICDLRQPVIFDYNVDGLINDCNLDTISNNFGAFDIKVRNVKEYDDVSELYLPLTMNTAMDIFRKDKNERFVSENNGEFLEETSIIKSFRYNDNFLRTYSVSNFGKYIDDFKALDYDGNALSTEKIDINTWTIVNATKLDRIEYYVNDTYDTEKEGGIGKEVPFSPSILVIAPPPLSVS